MRQLPAFRIFVGLLSALLLHTAALGGPMNYIYPPPESGADVRMNFYWDVLQLALDETSAKWGPYTLQASPKVMTPGRAEVQLSAAQDITLMARTTSVEREKKLIPLRIPLDKGLTGYRLFLIKGNNQAALGSIRGLKELRQFSIGQAGNWVDGDILRHSELQVVPGPTYESLFSMLDAGRFDLFSRGVNEISAELAANAHTYPSLTIEKKLLLYYPLPRYFFFSRTPEGEQLAARAEEGLRILMRNGKFQKRYAVFKKSLLEDLQLSGRRILRIPNPLLPPETPLADKALWDDLSAELR
ncbi:amino acid ABC transporter substrate-binding protein [Rhodoferax bucti]|uniref:amino acid ABC transporter substrate-binding protein n=1 Tax=Rhodoferax bucti TaxID=2576305 RepID=UPI001108A487|nr:amino acid ABC transporter substrate-binding protein [Rhodoferax bucti]